MKSLGPHDGIRPLKEETRKTTSSLPLHAHAQKEGYVRTQREGGNPRGELSPDTDTAGTLIWDFQSAQL